MSSGAPTGTRNSRASSADAPSAPIVWVAPAQGDVEQLVERVLFDVGPGEVLAELGRAPHRHDGERLAVGEVHPLDAQHGVDTEELADPPRRFGERELDDAALVGHAAP